MTESTFTMNDKQKAIVAKLSKDDVKVFNALTDTEKQTYFMQQELVEAGKVINEKDLHPVSMRGEDRTNYPIIGVKTENNPLGIVAGQIFRANYIGTSPMYSKEPKENWDKIQFNNEIFYESCHHVFEREDGTRFGIYDYAGLAMLKKIPTKETDPQVARNPTVTIKYEGLIEGREILEKKYGIKLSTGNKSHVFMLDVEKGHEFDRYAKGIVNYVKPPYPAFASQVEDTKDPQQIAMKNWEKLQNAKEEHKQRLLGISASQEAKKLSM